MLDSSGITEKSTSFYAPILNYELRVCLLICPVGLCVAMPFSFYLESTLLQRTLQRLRTLTTTGDIKFLSPFPDIQSYIHHKRETYLKSASVERYKSAYYLNSIPSSVESLRFSNGSTEIARSMLFPWKDRLLARAKSLNLSEKRIINLTDRARESEERAFLWDSLSRLITKSRIGDIESRKLAIRQLYNAEYVSAYSAMGYDIPHNSALVNNIQLPQNLKPDLNLHIWKRLFDAAKFSRIISAASDLQLLHLKLDPTLLVLIDQARMEMIQSGGPSPYTVTQLSLYRSNIDFRRMRRGNISI